MNNPYQPTNEQSFTVRKGVLRNYCGAEEAVFIPSGVREISSGAFANAAHVKSIHIPDSVVRIGRSAFSGCASLREITLGFGATEIPEGCFANLRELETVTLTDRVKVFGAYAFYRCEQLKRVSFLSHKFRGPVTPGEKGLAYEALLSGNPVSFADAVPAKGVPPIVSIGEYAFSGCGQLDTQPLRAAAATVAETAFAPREGSDPVPKD